MRFYKVVYHNIDGRFNSWAIPDDLGRFTLEYFIGKMTWAPLGTVGLMVFKNLKCAISFDNMVPNKRILEGKAILAKPQEYIAMARCSDIIRWMNGDTYRQMEAPLGTYVCAGFKPERIVNV